MQLSVLRDSRRKLARGAACPARRAGRGLQFPGRALRRRRRHLHRRRPPTSARSSPPGDQPYPGGSRGFGRADRRLRAGAVRPVGRSTLAPVAATPVASAEPVRPASAPAATAPARPATGRASAGASRRPHRDRHRADAVRRAAGAGGRRREGLVARRRHADHRQGRRDRLQSVAPLRRAGRRAHEAKGLPKPTACRPARRSSSRPMSIRPRRRSRRPTTIRSRARRSRRAASDCRQQAAEPGRRSRCCRSRRRSRRQDAAASARDKRRATATPRPRVPAGTYTVQTATRCRGSPGRPASASPR